MEGKILILLAALGFVFACGDGEDPFAIPDPEYCAISPETVAVPPQSNVEFDVDCDGPFEFADDAVGRSWSQDGQISGFQFAAPEVPGEYTVTVFSRRAPEFRASATVTVQETEYDLSTDLVWAHDLDNTRVWVGPDSTVLVETHAGKLAFLTEDLEMIQAYDGWSGGSGDIVWSESDPDLLYMIGMFHNFEAASSSEVLSRFRWPDSVLERYYVTGSSALQGNFSLEISPDETLAGYWLPNRAVIRELDGERTIFQLTAGGGSGTTWLLSGIAYDDAGPDEVYVFAGFTGNTAISFSPDGTVAILGGQYFIDLETGELLSTDPFDARAICIEYGISERDCPDQFPIVIDNQRLVAFGWPNGRPAIFNYVEGTIEVSPPDTGVFSFSVAPDIQSYEFGANRETLLLNAVGESVMVDLTTQPVSALWNREIEGPARRQRGALGPDGEWLVVLDYADEEGVIGPNNITVLDSVSGEPLRWRDIGTGGPSGVTALRWSPDGERLSVRVSGNATMLTRDGDPLFEVPPEFAYLTWIGDELVGLRRNLATRDIEALEYRDQDTFEATGEELVLDFGERESRFLNDIMYAHPNGSLIWITSDAMTEGGMAFDTTTGEWRSDIQSEPEWVTVQLPVEQPRGVVPEEICGGEVTCTVELACAAWDPTGRYLAEAWTYRLIDSLGHIPLFRLVDNTGTARRELETYTFHTCTAAAWHPSDPLLAVIDGTEIKLVDVSNPLGQ